MQKDSKSIWVWEWEYWYRYYYYYKNNHTKLLYQPINMHTCKSSFTINKVFSWNSPDHDFLHSHSADLLSNLYPQYDQLSWKILLQSVYSRIRFDWYILLITAAKPKNKKFLRSHNITTTTLTKTINS